MLASGKYNLNYRMKRTIKFLALLMAVLSSTSAMAVDAYEVMKITPAEGDVEGLQHFTITFDGLPVVVNEAAVPTIQKGGGATWEGRMRADDDGTTVIVDFDENLTASGHYFLNLPENSITVNGQRLLPLSLRYNIAGTMESFYEQITIDPAEGPVESLRNFTVSFPEYVGEINFLKRVTLTNTTTGTTYHANTIGVNYTALIYLDGEVTEAGEYVLTIPAGTVEFYTIDEEIKELTYHYTIEEQAPSFYEQITIDPAEGEVDLLQHFTVNLPLDVDRIAEGSVATLTNTTSDSVRQASLTAQGSNVHIDFDTEAAEAGRYTLSIPEGTIVIDALGEQVHELTFNYLIPETGMPDFTINPPEGELYMLQYFTIAYGQHVVVDEDVHPVLTNDDSGEEFPCNLLEIGGNAVIYKEYPLSDTGRYTLSVPAKCIMIEATGQTNPEMVFRYAVVEKDVYIPPVIEAQPEGEVRLYQRSGGLVREAEKEDAAEDDEHPYEIVFERQAGVLSIVFGEDNKVYIQRPVSWTYYDGWIEGTLGEDGKTITVPMGQYVAYARSLEMAVQVGIFSYDESLNTYVYNPSVEELTYTINDDGSITQNGTDANTVLGVMNRAFGQNFQYLDYEWLQSGDFASLYTPINEVPETPPAGMETETYYLTTAINDGMQWDPYRKKVNVGFEGDNVWIQGISEYLPNSWIKGVCVGNTVTFANPQLLGTNDIMFYFKCAEFNPLDGSTAQKDMVLTIDEMGTMRTYDYIFITVDKENLEFVNYYQGLTLSQYPDALIHAPQDLPVKEYVFSYVTQYDVNRPKVEDSHTVYVGFNEDVVYIRGLWPGLPNSWVAGRIRDGKIVMPLPEYMGEFYQEYMGTYPIYLGTFDMSNGQVLRELAFDYNEDTGEFSNMLMPLSIGINKTGYLSLQDYSDLVFTPVNSSVRDLKADADGQVEYYDLQGRRLNDISTATGIIIVKNADGSVTKLLKH